MDEGGFAGGEWSRGGVWDVVVYGGYSSGGSSPVADFGLGLLRASPAPGRRMAGIAVDAGGSSGRGGRESSLRTAARD